MRSMERPTPRRRSASPSGVVASAIAAALALTACQTQRPVGLLQRDGDQAMRFGHPEIAVEHYQQWVERQPYRAEAHHSLGLALLEAGRPAEAAEHLTVAYDHEPDNEQYFDDMALALRQAGREQTLLATLHSNAVEQGAMRDYLRLGKNLMAIGSMDEAYQALKTAADMDAGRTVEPQLALADMYHRLDRPSEELRRLRMAYAINPNDQRVLDRLDALDVIPGPSLALPPEQAP